MIQLSHVYSEAEIIFYIFNVVILFQVSAVAEDHSFDVAELQM